MSSKGRLRETALRLLLAGWLGAMLWLGAGLLARHAVALPPVVTSPKLGSSLGALHGARARDSWLAAHALYAECRCSQRIVSHLASSSRPAGWEELVLWVGKAPPPPELARRFRVARLSSAELAGLGVEAAPSLVVVDSEGRVRYAGGYTSRK
ncbi:MAG TPA: hypothetical protein VGK73_37255, partial [Polyangiaceae bacterium]